MLKKILSVVAGLAISLNLLMPAPALAQIEYDYDWDSFSTEYDYDDIYSTTSDLTDEEAAAAAGLALLFGGVWLAIFGAISLVSYIYISLTLYITAKKLKSENLWFAWVPLLNLYLMCKMAGLSAWSMLLWLVPLVNVGYAVYLYMKIAEKRGFPNYIGLLILVPALNFIIPGYIAWAEPSKK